MSDPFWTEDPTILIKKEKLMDLWPMKNMSSNEKCNAITRLIAILTVIGVITTRSAKLFATGLITIGVIVFLCKSKKKKVEAFTNLKDLAPNNHLPTTMNPMMNVLLTEYHDNPKRKKALPAYEAAVEKDINETVKNMVKTIHKKDGIDEKLFKDLGDNYQFDQSMRQFFTTANTTIPNDQKGFAEFCYGDMVSCKEGNDFACHKKNYRFKAN